MFDLTFYNMISKVINLKHQNYKELYQTFSYNTRENRFDEINIIKDNLLYLIQHEKYFR